ncbi:MAG TPA: ROK family transcriptional regulator [Mycobacteriales bacterium]|nr:ROK family transcriptional regulator [Mycobacteriales bacterium]
MPALPDNPLARLRRGHVDQIVGHLTRSGPCSRAELARATGLSRTTLSTVAAGLLESGMVREIDAAPRAERGRPSLMLALDPVVPVAIGVDIAHRRTRVTIAGAGRRILATATQAARARTPWADRVGAAVALLEATLAEHRLPTRALEGIGIGVVGPVDDKRAEVTRTEFGRRFPVPILVDNNTRLAGLAETTLGAATDAQVLYVRLSNGVGGAAVVGGELIHGASGAAAEIGHLCIDPDGPPCWCGGAGCLETYISVPALLARCRPHGIRSVAALRRSAAEPVTQLLRDVGTTLGIALAHAATILNPSRIIVGGELGTPALLRAAETEMRRRTMPTTHRDLTVDPAALSDEDGALGGICLVLTNPRPKAVP